MKSASDSQSKHAPTPGLEDALARTEAAADASLKAATAANKALKQVRSATQQGNLREVRPALAAAEQSGSALQAALAQMVQSWQFDDEGYLSNGWYTRELLETAARMGVRVFEQDERLYCYPSLVRVLPGERAVLIDRTRDRRLRPSVLVAHLRELQGRPPRFRPEAFLESLLKAYNTLSARSGRGGAQRLVDVYELFTLLPGQAREYSKQDFARDIYLLDGSGVGTTRSGQTVTFPASTGTRSSASAMIRVVTQSGEEKSYYGIAFTAAQ